MPPLSERRRAILHEVESHVLTPDLIARSDQCPRCRGVRGAGFSLCASCSSRNHLHSDDFLFFASCVAKESPFYAAFKYYKTLSGTYGAPHIARLAATLSGGYEQHAPAIATALGGTPTVVTAVPSTRGRTWDAQPLRTVLLAIGAVRDIAAPCIEYTGVARAPRTLQPGLFRTTRDVHGERILLVEDLWAGGSTAETAREELIDKGANTAVLSIGREIRPDFLTASELIAALGRPTWW